MPKQASLRHSVRVGRKGRGAKKKKTFSSVAKAAQGKGVRNPGAYAASIFRAQGIEPAASKYRSKKKR